MINGNKAPGTHRGLCYARAKTPEHGLSARHMMQRSLSKGIAVIKLPTVDAQIKHVCECILQTTDFYECIRQLCDCMLQQGVLALTLRQITANCGTQY